MNIWRSDYPLKVKLEATAHLTSNFAYLLLVVLCFLIYPKDNFRPKWALLEENPWMEHILNIPIFFFGSVSVALFYLMAQKALRPNTWWKELKYLPLLLALGIGMSVNNAKAVLEAIFNHQSGFVRTPKYGIGETFSSMQKNTGWKSSRYKAIKSLTPFIELAFAFFFSVVVLTNLIDGHYLTAVLLSPFPIGFYFTSLPSLRRMLITGKQEVDAIVDEGK